MDKFMYQCSAEIKRAIRNPYYVFWSLFVPVCFYFIFTKVFTFNESTEDQALWAAHYLMSMATFSVMGSSLMTLGIRMVQDKQQGFTKFLKVMPLPESVYLISQMLGQSVIHIFSIAVIFLAGVLIHDVSLRAVEWVSSGLWVLLGSAVFLALGTLVGTMKKVETASGVSNILYLGMALLGGMWMPLNVMPSFLQDVAKWLPSYHYANGPWEIIRGNWPEWQNVLLLVAYTVLFMILSIYIRRKQEVV
ncbi:ABC transporter permease [Cerasibacillus sp. JNUCC 74]|jgi:ABC-2 type transport system permease protein|uniref:ABC transporter permease n=1 Tax=Virgibacillus proomii TaxID=84407 RepID=UPI000984294B|nr:ABC transporter permease [Virgibacillus proomii]